MEEFKKNHEGYSDPTAYQALSKIEKEQFRLNKCLKTMKSVADLSGFIVEERIVLKDKKSGEVWR